MTKEEIKHNHIKEIAEKYIQENRETYLDLVEPDLVLLNLVLAVIGVAEIISEEHSVLSNKQMMQMNGQGEVNES